MPAPAPLRAFLQTHIPSVSFQESRAPLHTRASPRVGARWRPGPSLDSLCLPESRSQDRASAGLFRVPDPEACPAHGCPVLPEEELEVRVAPRWSKVPGEQAFLVAPAPSRRPFQTRGGGERPGPGHRREGGAAAAEGPARSGRMNGSPVVRAAQRMRNGVGRPGAANANSPARLGPGFNPQKFPSASAARGLGGEAGGTITAQRPSAGLGGHLVHTGPGPRPRRGGPKRGWGVTLSRGFVATDLPASTCHRHRLPPHRPGSP